MAQVADPSQTSSFRPATAPMPQSVEVKVSASQPLQGEAAWPLGGKRSPTVPVSWQRSRRPATAKLQAVPRAFNTRPATLPRKVVAQDFGGISLGGTGAHIGARKDKEGTGLAEELRPQSVAAHVAHLG